MIVNFKKLYRDTIKNNLSQAFGYKNVHQIPAIQKIVLNMGVGESIKDSKIIANAVNDMKMISGQKPSITKAKKSIATFKLREGMSIGCKVTLRNSRMYDFLERLVWVALPRVKEFRGFSDKSFDKSGNFSFGLKEQIIFPEINYDKTDAVRGMDVTIVTSATTKSESKALLESFSIPFRN